MPAARSRRSGRTHGGGRRATHRNPAASQRRAPPPRAVNETSSSEFLRFGSPAAGSALNLGGSTPSLAGSASAHSPFLQPPPSRTPAYGCGRGRCQARRLRPPATALTRAGCGLRRPPCPAAGASQERPRGCCLTRSAPSLADPPAIARAGLIPGFLLSALFDVVVFFLSGLSAVRHCCPPRTPESQVRPSVFYWSSLPGRPLSFCSKKQPRDSKRGVHFTAADENKGTIPHQCRKHYLKYDVSSQSIQL